jgi:PAS domain S-box-containing protein
VASSAFLVAFLSPVPPLAALGQAIGATSGSFCGRLALRRLTGFDPSLPRLRDALALVMGAFGSAAVSASIGLFSLYATEMQAYSGLGSAWLIYWLGDATGVLLVTPLVFTLPGLLEVRSRGRLIELAALLVLLPLVSILVFGELSVAPIQLDMLAFVVLPFVMWAAISFGIAGASLSVFIVAAIATVYTAFGSGPFAQYTPFVNAVLLDVLFVVLGVSALALAAVIAEREHAEAGRLQLVREQIAVETRLQLAAIVESSEDAIFSTSLDGLILTWNKAAERIFGYTEAEVLGRPTAMLCPLELRAESNRVRQRVREGFRTEHFETTRIAKSGARLDVFLTVSPLKDAGERVIGAAEIVRDITVQRRAEKALSSVTRKLIDAQEKERGRIARELHDDISQRLALLAAKLGGLAPEPLGADRLSRETADLQKEAAEIAADVQTLSHSLHASKLQLLGLTAAMKQFCEDFSSQHHIQIDFDTSDLPRQLPSDVSLSFFRILQEAAHNAAKHSQSPKFNVRLWGARGELHLAMTDFGKGFDAEAATTGRGIGLISMEERIKLVNGDLSIDSSPGRGTTIHAYCALRGGTPEV